MPPLVQETHLARMDWAQSPQNTGCFVHHVNLAVLGVRSPADNQVRQPRRRTDRARELNDDPDHHQQHDQPPKQHPPVQTALE